MDEKFYWAWLNGVSGIGAGKLRKLMLFFESPKEIYELKNNSAVTEYLAEIDGITQKDIANITDKKYKEVFKKEYERLTTQGIGITTINSPDYPSKLKDIFDAPFILYYRGKLPDEAKRHVAIVGARNCSEYGRTMAKSIAKQLAEYDVAVVSGFARGIDTAAHNGALEAGGETTAVFGCGINVCYPTENHYTYSDILEKGGCIMSEFLPEQKPLAGLFPLRNRIISGLADLVIVMEAGKRSGSLITADHALEQNRTVMALPGRVTDRLSDGCNYLISQGAGIVSCFSDILFELGIDCEETINKNKKNKINLAIEEKMLYSLVDFSPICINELISKSEMSPQDTVRVLMQLELKGCIREAGKNYYIRQECKGIP